VHTGRLRVAWGLRSRTAGAGRHVPVPAQRGVVGTPVYGVVVYVENLYS
jgi:hypothetical protein